MSPLVYQVPRCFGEKRQRWQSDTAWNSWRSKKDNWTECRHSGVLSSKMFRWGEVELTAKLWKFSQSVKISLGSYLALPDVDSFVPSTISDPNPNDGGTELLVKLREKESLHPNVRLLQSSAAGQLASNYTDITRTATPYFVFHLNSFRVSLGKPFGKSIQEPNFFSLQKTHWKRKELHDGDSGITGAHEFFTASFKSQDFHHSVGPYFRGWQLCIWKIGYGM